MLDNCECGLNANVLICGLVLPMNADAKPSTKGDTLGLGSRSSENSLLWHWCDGLELIDAVLC